MNAEQFHIFLQSRGFKFDDCGMVKMYSRGRQMIVVPAFDEQASRLFHGGVSGQPKQTFEFAKLPADTDAADRIVNQLAQIERDSLAEDAPKGSWVLSTPTGPVPVEFADWGPKVEWTENAWPPCQSFAERRPGDNLTPVRILDYLFRSPEIREDIPKGPNKQTGELVYRELRREVELLEEQTNLKAYTSIRTDNERHPHICEIRVTYKSPDFEADAVCLHDFRDGSDFATKILKTECGADRLANHRRRILEVTELRARIHALRKARKLMMERTLRRNRQPWYETIEPGIYRIKLRKTDNEHAVLIGKSATGRRWIASTLFDRPMLLADFAEQIKSIATTRITESPKAFHITIDGKPLCADFEKFTTELRAQASQKFGFIPRCGYSSHEEDFADANADVVRQMVPNAEIEVVTSACPVQGENDEARQASHEARA